MRSRVSASPGHPRENFDYRRHVRHQADPSPTNTPPFFRVAFSHRQVCRTCGLRRRAVLRFTTMPVRDERRAQYPSGQLSRPVIAPDDGGDGTIRQAAADAHGLEPNITPSAPNMRLGRVGNSNPVRKAIRRITRNLSRN